MFRLDIALRLNQLDYLVLLYFMIVIGVQQLNLVEVVHKKELVDVNLAVFCVVNLQINFLWLDWTCWLRVDVWVVFEDPEAVVHHSQISAFSVGEFHLGHWILVSQQEVYGAF